MRARDMKKDKEKFIENTGGFSGSAAPLGG